MAELIKAGDFGGPGEERTAAYLEKNLPTDWKVICNKELVLPTGGCREIDFIIVAQHTVFVVDEKSWSGHLHGNENGWVMPSGESCVSPLSNVDGVARRVAGHIRNNVPRVKSEVAGHFVFGRVILSSDNVHLYVHDARVAEGVLKLRDCEGDLERFDGLQQSIASIQPYRDRIVSSLTALSNRPKVPRKIGEFDIVEELGAVGPIRSFKARHRDGSLRVLKLIKRPTTLDTQRRHAQETLLMREYHALKRLSESGRVPKVDPYFSWDQDQYWILPIDSVDGRSLRANRTDAVPCADKVLLVLEDAFKALAAVHDSDIVHRALSPDRIYLRASGSVCFTDFVIARIPQDVTIAEDALELASLQPYSAPECRVGYEFADKASDVYGLVASLLYWVAGFEPECVDGKCSAPPAIASLRSDIQDDLAQLLDTIAARGLNPDERARPTAATLLEKVEETRLRRISPVHRLVSTTHHWEPGSIVADRYKVIRLLGVGATAGSYLVEDEVADARFVLKVIRHPELVAQLARSEFRSLMDLAQENLPRVYDIEPLGSPFHLKLEYVEGLPLREVMAQYRGNVKACLHIGHQVLRALAYLGDRNLIHRDVSPSNIIVPEDDRAPVKLIDFGLATANLDTVSVVGTPRYRAPEVERGERWTQACDLYSLGVILFEMLVGRVPYGMPGGTPDKRLLLGVTADESHLCPRRLGEVLLKSMAADPRERFQSARDFEQALVDALTPEPVVPPVGDVIHNPFVDDLRGAYRNSAIGNADNRGLDTRFSTDTYVKTRLDIDLLPKLLGGSIRLLLLCGNPGDGKTAFLQRMREELLSRGASPVHDDAAGWSYSLGDHTFASLYDASESHDALTADDLLHKILAPLRGTTPQGTKYTAAIAVNDGRLLDFFDRNGALRYQWLWKQVRPQLFNEESWDPSVVVVDLKRRTLVGHDVSTDSLFSRILDEFVATDRWKACHRCAARDDCPIHVNALSFMDSALGPLVRRRLAQLILAVHLRRERRATVRDLRSALAYLITHNLGCDAIHAEREAGRSPLAEWSRLYFNAAFDGSGGPDLLLDEWAQLDPAGVPVPRLDRFLFFHRNDAGTTSSAELLVSPLERPALPHLQVESAGRSWLSAVKRRVYFESLERTGENPLELPGAGDLFIYRHFPTFTQALQGQVDDSRLLTMLSRGISLADGVPPHAAKECLALRTSDSTSDTLAVVKTFPLSQFVIGRPSVHGDFAETVVDHLVIEHTHGFPSLAIGLDLFEFLCRAADGYLPGPEEQGALLEDLATFKHQLLARPSHEVILIERGVRAHRVRTTNGQISYEEAMA